MRFRNSDVVVQLGPNVETEEFATAAGVAGEAAAEFGAAASEIRRADPEAGRTGFLVDVLSAVPVAEYRLDVRVLEFHGDPHSGHADLPLWPEVTWDGYLLHSPRERTPTWSSGSTCGCRSRIRCGHALLSAVRTPSPACAG